MNGFGQALDSERAVIGTMLVDASRIDRMASMLSPQEFADNWHRKLFEMLTDRRDRGLPLDAPAVYPEAKKIIGEEAGAVLGELSRQSTCDPEYHALIVKDGSRRRRASQTAQLLVEQLSDPTTETGPEIERAAASLEEVNSTSKPETISAYDAGRELLQAVKDKEYHRPLYLGVDEVDSSAGGFMPGELVIIAGRTSSGKTVLGMQSAQHNAERGRKVLFVSLEMTAIELIGRVLCGMSDADGPSLRSGQLSDAMRASMAEAIESLRTVPMEIAAPARATLARIRRLARIQRARGGLDLLVVDYIGLVQPRDQRQERRLQVAEVTAGLKAVAKELNVGVLALAQLNREAAKGSPQLFHLADSTSVEQDADMVFMVDRELGSDEAEIVIAKNRHGSVFRQPVPFDAKSMKFGRTRTEVWVP